MSSSSPESGAAGDRTTPLPASGPAQSPPSQNPPSSAAPINPARVPDPSHDHRHSTDHGSTDTRGATVEHTAVADRPDRNEVRNRQKERFGGIKWGAAFFGWLTAIGTAVLLTTLITAAGAAFGLATTGGGQQAADQAGQAAQTPGAAQTAGITSAILAAVVLLIAYYCGGYVAGRMARFSGAKQGIAVWVWTILITVALAVLATVAGSQFNVLSSIGGLPQLPVDPAALGLAGILTVLVALAVSLIGAVLGGLAGMRYHRKIDRADLHRNTDSSTTLG